MVLQLILIQVITFAVIIAVLRLLFGTQLKVALNRLQILHQDSLEKEGVLNKELERAKVQSQSEIARAKEEAKNIIDTARRNAEKITASASESAQLQTKKLIAEAQEKAKKLESEILAGTENKAINLAQDLVRFTFTPKGQEVLHRQLIDELIDELKKVDKTKLTVKVDRAEIGTSSPLTPEEKQRLKEILSSKLGYELTLEEKVDASLIVGLVIKLGGLVIDGSLKNKMARAMNALRLKKTIV